MNNALREEMVAEIQGKLAAKEANERARHYTNLDQEPRMTSRWIREMEGYKKNSAKGDEEYKAKPLNLDTVGFHFSKNPSDTNSIIGRKLRKHVLKESSSIQLDVSTDGDTNNAAVSRSHSSHVSNVAGTNSKPAKRKQEGYQRISSDATAANTSQLMKDRISRNSIHSFMAEKPRCEKIHVSRTLMEEHWKEWVDKQEMRRNLNKIQPADEQKAEKQRGTAHPAPGKQMKQNIKGVSTVMKIKTYLSDLFIPHASYMWKRLEDETDHLCSEEE